MLNQCNTINKDTNPHEVSVTQTSGQVAPVVAVHTLLLASGLMMARNFFSRWVKAGGRWQWGVPVSDALSHDTEENRRDEAEEKHSR